MLLDKRNKVRNIHLSIIDYFCLLHHVNMAHDWNMCRLQLLCFIIDAPHRSNSVSIHDFLVRYWKDWPFLRGYFSSWGHSVVPIVVVERFKQQSLYGLSLGQPKVATGGLTVPTRTAFLCTVDKTWISPDWMKSTNLSLTFHQKSFICKLAGKKRKKMDEQIDYSSSPVWSPPQNRIPQLISKRNQPIVIGFLLHSPAGEMAFTNLFDTLVWPHAILCSFEI